MKRGTLISQLKHLLNLVDKLEFNAEQNRKQIAETRLLVAGLVRTIYFAKKLGGRKAVSKRKFRGKKNLSS